MAEHKTKMGAPQPAGTGMNALNSGGSNAASDNGSQSAQSGSQQGSQANDKDPDKNKAKTDTEGAGSAGSGGKSTSTATGAQAAGKDKKDSADTDKGKTGADTTSTEITDEALKTYLEKNGISGFTSLEDLKKGLEKKDPPPAPKAPTEEEKKQQQKEFRNKVLNLYMRNGGDVKDFVAIEHIMGTDPKDLSLSEIHRELKEAKFTDEEISAIVKERYYQLDDDEIAQFEDETDREFAKRKKEYGSKKIANRALPIKEQAKKVYQELEDSVKSEELLAQKETEFSSKVDEHFKKLKRKIDFDMGEQAGKKLEGLQIEIQDEEINEVSSILKDPVKRQQFFYNEDNSLNLANVGDVMLKNKLLERALKVAYQTASEKTIAELKKVFPEHPLTLGLGKGTNGDTSGKGQAGKIAGFGKPQVARPQQKQI